MIKQGSLHNFLRRTDFIPFFEIKSIVETLFNEKWAIVKEAEAFKILFGDDCSGNNEYENLEFQEFHKKLMGKCKKPEDNVDKYVHMPMESRRSKDAYIREAKESIFREHYV